MPQLVTLLTFHEGTAPATFGERVAQFEHLTELGRIAAGSPATRALVLYSADRSVTPDDFLVWSRDEPPGAALMLWVTVRNAGGELSTHGLAGFGLPEAGLSLGAKAGPAELEHATDVLLTLGLTMIRQQGRVADGTRLGESWEARFDGEKLRVTTTARKPAFWRRLFR